MIITPNATGTQMSRVSLLEARGYKHVAVFQDRISIVPEVTSSVHQKLLRSHHEGQSLSAPRVVETICTADRA